MSIPATKGQIKITPGALVCNEAEIIGDVSIGVRTVVHPKARIIAEGGPIIIGDGNLIEEQTLITNRRPGHTLLIGHSNVFEIGSRVEAIRIGDNNVFEAKTVVGPQIEVTNGCVVGAMCKLTSSEKLSENTVVFGSDCKRRKASEKPAPQMLQLDFLTKILPNYHHMKGRGK
ncbi:dynactin subunit 6-like [Hydractinia symbiolongicarpus]|uniref:dynactin subunit 6-like n=1 Tax=Hydractinia symbiolongicarpus TaxID=13093 RepID=UPI00254CD65E|nr:dynactin subunit 6-like [Hydractinia symbiolongicarpus]